MKLFISISSVFDDLFTPIIKNINQKDQELIKHYIKESVKLKKQDRRMYFLKFLRYQLYEKNKLSGVKAIEKDAHLFKSKNDIEGVFLGLVHPYELHIGAIEVFHYADKNVDDVIEAFAEMSQQSSKDSLIAIEDTDIIYKKFPDGFYWVHINKPFCTIEGKAMGHCGNEPSHKPDDTIFSLRRQVHAKGRLWWESKYCTIIQDYGKYLGEIRGRFNTEPELELLDHIIALLKDHTHFKGVKPKSDYVKDSWEVLSHLNQKQADELKEHNPKLAEGIVNSFPKVEIEGLKISENKNGAIYFSGQTFYFAREGILFDCKKALCDETRINPASIRLVDKDNRRALVQYGLENKKLDYEHYSQIRLLCNTSLSTEKISSLGVTVSNTYDKLTEVDTTFIGKYKGMYVEDYTSLGTVPDIEIGNLTFATQSADVDVSKLPRDMVIKTLTIKGGLHSIPESWSVQNIILGTGVEADDSIRLRMLDNDEKDQNAYNSMMLMLFATKSEAVLLKALDSTNALMCAKVASNPNASEKVLTKAISNPKLIHVVARNPGASTEFLSNLISKIRSKTADYSICEAIASNPNASNEVLVKLHNIQESEDSENAKDHDFGDVTHDINVEIAKNPNTDSKLLGAILDHKFTSELLQGAIATNSNVTDDQLLKLIEYGNTNTLDTIANLKDLDANVIKSAIDACKLHDFVDIESKFLYHTDASELFKKEPSYATLEYCLSNTDTEYEEILTSKLEGMKVEYDLAKHRILIAKFDSINEYAEYFGLDTLKHYTNEDWFPDASDSNIEDSQIKDLLSELKDKYTDKYQEIEDSMPEDYSDVEDYVTDSNDEMCDKFKSAISRGIETGIADEVYEYVNNSVDDIQGDGTVHLYASFRELKDILTLSADNYDERNGFYWESSNEDFLDFINDNEMVSEQLGLKDMKEPNYGFDGYNEGEALSALLEEL